MKKLLFLLGLISLAVVSQKAFASKKDQKEPFTYVEVGAFTTSKKDNAIIVAYGMRQFYPHNMAIDRSLFMGVGLNGSFLVIYKYVGLLYLPPIKSTITPYVGIGGLAGMVSYKNIYNKRHTDICSNALAVLGAQIDLKDHTHFLAATYHLNTNMILLTVGRAF